jgi:RsiW-degrading membrane proteinase PrsW (M82 family)
MTLLIASITPVIIFLYLIFKKDKKPIGLLAKCFFGGFISIIIALIIAFSMTYIGTAFQSPLLKSFYDAFFVAAIPEEFAKFIVLYWIIWESNFFDEHYDGIIYAVFVSLGFALVENILYVFAHGIGIAFVRAILAVPGHGLFAVAMGYFLSLAKFNKQKDLQKYLLLSLVVPMGLHGTYNFLLMYSSNLSKADAGVTVILLIIFTVFIIFLWRHGIKKIKILVAKDSINSNITSLV